ncbi:hypothetical protein OIV83_001616 [Microbotryomycetes sp. JL201]|nr:hypothetical protein OIV83_001616 [Microbotryomycetes sp. JL201]
MPRAEPSRTTAVIKLVLTVTTLIALAIVIKLVVDAVQQAVKSTKKNLSDRGVNISSSGVAIKTERQQVTTERSADAARAGIMKAWKASTFNVPWALSKASNLSGSTHDKNKEEWEAIHGPKKHKTH